MLKSQTMNYDFLIITPTFLRDKLLKENIESVQNQCYENYLHLIVDDAPSENTRKTVENYKDGRIVYIQRQRNPTDLKTSCNALNFGLSYSKLLGYKFSYIKILHDDDLLYKGVLKRHAEILQNQNYGMVMGREMRIDETNGTYEIKGEAVSNNPDIVRMVTLATYIQYTSLTYRYEYFIANTANKKGDTYKPHICFGEDKDVTARYLKLLSKLNKEVAYDQEICSIYRKSGADRITTSITEEKREKDIQEVVCSNTTNKELFLVKLLECTQKPLRVFPKPWRKKGLLLWLDEKLFHNRKTLDYDLVYWWKKDLTPTA